MASQVSIKDQDSAIKWLMNIQGINEDYHRAMKEAGETLQSMDQFAEGNIVDDLVNMGTSILNAGEQVFNAIESISETVKNVLSTVEKFKDGVVDAIAGVVKKIF